MSSETTEPRERSMDTEHREDLYIIVSTDTIGKDEDIGAVLMKGFFATMRETKEIPHTIFFLNAGVKLTTVNEEVAPILKDIESMGVEIYSCGTCLDHYDIEDKLTVGHRGSTTQVIEGINDFRSVWIK